VSVGEISLEGRWFDRIDRQDAQQYRMTGERFLVRSNNAAAGFGDCFCSLGRSSCRLLESVFRWAEALRARFGFARPRPGRCTLDHSRKLYSSSRINVLNLQLPSPGPCVSRNHRMQRTRKLGKTLPELVRVFTSADGSLFAERGSFLGVCRTWHSIISTSRSWIHDRWISRCVWGRYAVRLLFCC
jgi:hypothetical protein